MTSFFHVRGFCNHFLRTIVVTSNTRMSCGYGLLGTCSFFSEDQRDDSVAFCIGSKSFLLVPQKQRFLYVSWCNDSVWAFRYGYTKNSILPEKMKLIYQIILLTFALILGLKRTGMQVCCHFISCRPLNSASNKQPGQKCYRFFKDS